MPTAYLTPGEDDVGAQQPPGVAAAARLQAARECHRPTNITSVHLVMGYANARAGVKIVKKGPL